jgi:hypothetical protein
LPTIWTGKLEFIAAVLYKKSYLLPLFFHFSLFSRSGADMMLIYICSKCNGISLLRLLRFQDLAFQKSHEYIPYAFSIRMNISNHLSSEKKKRRRRKACTTQKAPQGTRSSSNNRTSPSNPSHSPKYQSGCWWCYMYVPSNSRPETYLSLSFFDFL